MRTKYQPLFAALFMVLIFGLTGCANLDKGLLSNAVKKPHASIDSIGISGITASSMQLTLNMKVTNPNQYALALAGYDYDVTFNELPLVKGSTNEGFRISAGDSGRISIPLTVAFSDVRKIYDSMGSNSTVNYNANVDLRLDAPVLNLFRLNTQKQGSITIPRLPEVSFGQLQIKRFSFSDIDLSLDMAINNPNNFAMNLKDLVYNISVSGRDWISGGLQDNLAIGKQKVTHISIPLKVKLTELSSGLLSALKSGNFDDFGVKGGFTLDGDHESLKNIKVPINFQGKP